jgi:hypothetical protein
MTMGQTAAQQAYQNYLEQLADYESKREAYAAAGKSAPTFSFQTPEARVAIDLGTRTGTILPGIEQAATDTPIVQTGGPADQFMSQLGVAPPVAAAAVAALGTGDPVPISVEVKPAEMLTNVWTGEKFAKAESQELVPLGLEQMGIPIGGSIPTWVKLLAGVGATAVGGGALGSILGLVSGGGSWSSVIGQGIGLLTGGGNGAGIGGSGMTTGMSADTYSQAVTGGTNVAGVPFGGPGVPEPPAGMVAKTWKTKAFSHTAGEYWVYFWKLIDGRVLCWNAAKREAKMWKPKKNMVLSSNPRLPDLLRFSKKANRLLFKLDKAADKASRQFARKR